MVFVFLWNISLCALLFIFIFIVWNEASEWGD